MKNEVKEKIINFIKWIKQECKDWKTLVVLIAVIIIMYFPVWGGYLLYYFFRWNCFLVMASAIFAFWLGPFTPFFPLCIAITLSIKKLMQLKNKKGDNYER